MSIFLIKKGKNINNAKKSKFENEDKDMPRFTKKLIQTLLDQNEGFEQFTSYKGKNFREDRHYKISGGKLHIHSKGKTSWSDSHFDEKQIADENQTRNFLKGFFKLLKSDGNE